MAADPVAAGRKGGSAKTEAQNAARRRNGFQRVKPCPDCGTDMVTANDAGKSAPPRYPVIIPTQQEQE